MDKKYVLSVTNTFDDRTLEIYGLYTENEAIEKLKKIHKDILDVWNDDEIYDNATMEDKDLENGFFFIDWGDDTYTDYNIIEVNENY